MCVTAKLRADGILTQHEGYKGKVMIDDAIFCFFFSPKATKQDKERKCKLVEDAIDRVYASLGLTIAKNKTIISSQMFLIKLISQGAEVTKPLRTLMKICTSIDRMIVTFQDQIQDANGSARGPIEKGADPVLAYVMSL